MKNNGIIGHTGFVGSNLLNQAIFKNTYNSKNISDISNKEFNILVCCGIPSKMWVSNDNPNSDRDNIQDLLGHIQSTKFNKLILISTVAVYAHPVDGFDENSTRFETVTPYGSNRRFAEKQLLDLYKEKIHIIRLPALFGPNLKKNFIYDLINRVPKFIRKDLYNKLNEKDAEHLLETNYIQNDSGFYCLKDNISMNDSMMLHSFLKDSNFTSLNFTNPESSFQFYDINNLWNDIQISIENDIRVLNIASEPIKAHKITEYFFAEDLPPLTTAQKYDYNMTTCYAKLWNKDLHYQYTKEDILKKLGQFFDKEIKK